MPVKLKQQPTGQTPWEPGDWDFLEFLRRGFGIGVERNGGALQREIQANPILTRGGISGFTAQQSRKNAPPPAGPPGGRVGGRARPNDARSRELGDQRRAREAASAPMTFADYLALANQLGLAGSGADYSALRAALQQNAARADAQLAAMFGQLQESIRGDAAGIGATYDTNAQNLQQAADQGASSIDAAYQAARDAQTQQFQQLGIGDAAAVLAAAGGNAAADQANALGNIAQNSSANQQANAQHRTSALNYNTNIANAAGLEGAVQRAAIQQELATKLAELQGAETEESNNRQRDLFSIAFQMAQNPGIFDPNYQGDPKSMLEAQLLAAQVTAQNLKNQGLAANTMPLGGNLTQYQTLAQAYGVDPSDQEAFLNFIRLVNETQR